MELGIWHAEKYKHTVWYERTIVDILRNPTYTGCIVYGRVPKSLYQGIKMHRADPDEWRILPDMHEPIVSRELFDEVQKILDDRAELAKKKKAKTKEQRDSIVNLFVKRIYCGDCGKRMRFVKKSNPKKSSTHYVCGGYLDSGYKRCFRHSIHAKDVEDAVFSAMKAQLDFCLDQEKLMEKMRGTAAEKNLIDQYVAKVRFLTGELKQVNKRREGLYENYVEGVLDETDYQYAKKKYDDEYEKLEKKLTEAKRKKKNLDNALSWNSRWSNAVHQLDGATVLNQALVDALVSRVLIYEGRRVVVEFKYREQKAILDKVVAELQRGCDKNE